MPIEHVYVLMLENRSFDHMLGFSGITATDAATGLPSAINGLTGAESNSYNGTAYPVTAGADQVMPTDPSHEFPAVVEQLCGKGATYPPGGPYPPIDNSGFVASYLDDGGVDGREIMKCYTPAQLPVLNALAAEFLVCDNWHASLPGPTWPNRMFVHAASSGGLDHSPTVAEIAEWESISGFHIPNGTVFDRLNAAGIRRRLYGGDDFPMVAALKGIHLSDIRHYSQFANDLLQPGYADQYVFIEPSYDVLNKYRNGSSQHPLGDVTRGEALIKQTYEAIRNSPVWDTSLLIVTWDEHGGFYDHVPPAAAPAPADGAPPNFNQNGFAFDLYGPRVPAIIVSPLIPRNQVDHRAYDHAAIPATLESLFGIAPLTERDLNALPLDALCTLAAARTDPPMFLPDPAAGSPAPATARVDLASATVAAPAETVNEGNLPAVVHSAMQQDMALSPCEARPAIIERVRNMQTRADALTYMAEVQQKIRAVRPASASKSAAGQ
jgi:phospholipase C